MEILNRPLALRYRPRLAEELNKDNRAKAAILAFCQRTYWRRVWVIQEIFLAKRYIVMCGYRSITQLRFNHSLTAILEAEYVSRFVRVDPQEYFGAMLRCSAAMEHLHAKRHNRTLITNEMENRLSGWLFRCAIGKFMATDPRDYIYALLPISDDVRRYSITPDYDKPVKTVFQEAYAAGIFDRDIRIDKRHLPDVRHGKHDGVLPQEIINEWLKNELGFDVWSSRAKANDFWKNGKSSLRRFGRLAKRYLCLGVLSGRTEGK